MRGSDKVGTPRISEGGKFLSPTRAVSSSLGWWELSMDTERYPQSFQPVRNVQAGHTSGIMSPWRERALGEDLVVPTHSKGG